MIQQLLAEAGHANVATSLVDAASQGVQMPADNADMRSPETYTGYKRASNFALPGTPAFDRPFAFAPPSRPSLNHWGLAGDWTLGRGNAMLVRASGRIVYRFHARDLHLVLGPGKDGKPVRFRVSLDGTARGDDHGTDVDAHGYGTVTEQRLYQLIRQKGSIADRTFSIEFLDPGVQAYAFTFG